MISWGLKQELSGKKVAVKCIYSRKDSEAVKEEMSRVLKMFVGTSDL